MRSWAASVRLRVRPETLVLAAFVIVLAILHLVYGGSLTADKLTAKVPFAAMATLIAAGTLADQFGLARAAAGHGWQSAARLASDWLPVVLCILVYENLHDVVKLIHDGTLDRQLAQIDAWLFGVQPTLWLQRLVTPWLTDALALAYASYFFTPTLLAALLYSAGRRAEFRAFMLAAIATMYLGFLGYVLVPAVGPVHHLAGLYDAPARLAGVFFYDAADALMNDYRSINRDCFPSLHTAISTLTLAFAWQTRRLHHLGRLVAWAYTPVIAALWFATVYLRYHWVIDVAAGWALAALVLAVVPRIARWWDGAEAKPA